MNIPAFVERLRTTDKSLYQRRMKYMMAEFGTSNACNRFDVGNAHEQFVADAVTRLGYKVTVHSHAKRIDIIVEDTLQLSIKYSSTGDIKLHNSLGANKDMTMKPTLLVTLDEWWLLDEKEMQTVGVDITPFLVNNGDGLVLKRSVLTSLRKANYPHILKVDLEVDRKQCKNRSCWELLYDHVKTMVPEEGAVPLA